MLRDQLVGSQAVISLFYSKVRCNPPPPLENDEAPTTRVQCSRWSRGNVIAVCSPSEVPTLFSRGSFARSPSNPHPLLTARGFCCLEFPLFSYLNGIKCSSHLTLLFSFLLGPPSGLYHHCRQPEEPLLSCLTAGSPVFLSRFPFFFPGILSYSAAPFRVSRDTRESFFLLFFFPGGKRRQTLRAFSFFLSAVQTYLLLPKVSSMECSSALRPLLSPVFPSAISSPVKTRSFPFPPPCFVSHPVLLILLEMNSPRPPSSPVTRSVWIKMGKVSHVLSFAPFPS